MLAHNAKQHRFHHELLTTDHIRTEMASSINEENKRVNEDSAKKKACMQHMDYDGFRQMVLGANLMPTKPGAISIYQPQAMMNFNQMGTIQTIQNTSAAAASLNNNANPLGYNEEIVRETLKYTGTDHLSAPRNQEEFQKFINHKCTDSFQRYTYMRLIKESHYDGLFNREFDCNLFMQVVNTFVEQVIQNEAFNNEQE